VPGNNKWPRKIVPDEKSDQKLRKKPTSLVIFKVLRGIFKKNIIKMFGNDCKPFIYILAIEIVFN